MEFTKDDQGKVTGEIKIDDYEAFELYNALRHYEKLVKDSNRYNKDIFDPDLMAAYVKDEEDGIARLKRQVELLRYELCPITICRENMEKLGQTGAEE